MINEKYDWETRNDADTLKRAKEIEANEERLVKAQACILDDIVEGKRALGIVPKNTEKQQPKKTVSRRANPATIGKLKY